MKFVPSILNNEYVWYNDIYSTVDNALVNFNKWIFIEKNKKISEFNPELSNTESILDIEQTQDDSSAIRSRSSGVYSLKNINKTTNNIANIPVCHETIELRNEIFNSISKYNDSMKTFTQNLSKEEIETPNEYCTKNHSKLLNAIKMSVQ